jgi:hypothetical protein
MKHNSIQQIICKQSSKITSNPPPHTHTHTHTHTHKLKHAASDARQLKIFSTGLKKLNSSILHARCLQVRLSSFLVYLLVMSRGATWLVGVSDTVTCAERLIYSNKQTESFKAEVPINSVYIQAWQLIFCRYSVPKQ